MASGDVRFVGEPGAAVLAPSTQQAEDVADLVEVGTYPTPAVVVPPAALTPGAPLVHSIAAANIVVEGRVKTARCDAAFAAAHRRIKVEIRSRRQNASPLEARAAHAAWDAASGRVTLTCTTQMPH